MRSVQVDDLTPDIRDQLGLKPDVKGVVVTDVANGSPASDASLQRGDVIEQVNRQNINSVSDYHRLISEAGKQTLVFALETCDAHTIIRRFATAPLLNIHAKRSCNGLHNLAPRNQTLWEELCKRQSSA